MQTLQKITATPHPKGNCIRLRWQNLKKTGVQIVRSQHSYPTTIDDGISIISVEDFGVESWDDDQLQGETVYYYSLFFDGESTANPQYRIAAMATEPYDSMGQMLAMLPAIYHRYDNESKQLQRFLELPGEQLDQLYSFASALLNGCDLDRVDGRLLPLLADWIGWQTNTRLEITKQRNEIRDAPYLYQTIGAIPNLEATIKRILGWESRTKEFVHNVFLTNSPEKLTIWQRHIKGDNTANYESISLDFAYEGRLAAAQDTDGMLWLFYHTLKHDRWEIWYKTRSQAGDWTASQPLMPDRAAIDEIHRYPTVAFQNDKKYVFWSCYNQSNQRWQIKYHAGTDQDWSTVEPFQESAADRRYPWAIADSSARLWLFWVESSNSQQTLKYTHYDRSTWQPSEIFPLDQGQDPNVTNDVTAIIVNQKLWVFWARQTGESRWQIAYRIKDTLNLSSNDWGTVQALTIAQESEDREPFALVTPDGKIELYWSSNRSGNWSIWRTVITPDASPQIGNLEQITTGAYTQKAPLAIPNPDNPQNLLLLYRSNQSISYESEVYTATNTTDFRYVGSTTVVPRNQAKQKLRERFDDIQTYTTVVEPRGRPQKQEEWYAWYARRDTIGLYLTPTNADTKLVDRDLELLKNILPQFLPIQVKVEFFPQVIESEDPYDTVKEVKEELLDSVGIAQDVEIYSGLLEEGSDRIPGWQLFKAYKERKPPGSIAATEIARSVELINSQPSNLQFRTWHAALTYDDLPDSPGEDS